VEVAFKQRAVVVGVPVRDTIKFVTADRRVESTPQRESLWEIQTPQVFQAEIIREAHRRAVLEGLEATDDAMLVEHLGQDVIVLEGHRTNIKITVAEDLLFAEALIQEGQAR
jgi:2-C-methyl-D-erythritol 4-phosphate cytidylyltransferase